jgi:DnaJ-class molecular chaperone
VPAGIQEGSVLRLKGLGQRPGVRESGDLFLKVTIDA